MGFGLPRPGRARPGVGFYAAASVAVSFALPGAADSEAPAVLAAVPSVSPSAMLPVAFDPPEAVQPTARASVAETPVPFIVWKPERRLCRRYTDGRRYCDGPRRVPVPYGAAASLAERLGLGSRESAGELLSDPVAPEWSAAVRDLGIAASEKLRWPVPTGNFGRGFRPREGNRPAHHGIDVSGETGDAVHAVADGLVAYSDNGIRGYGNVLLVIHGDDTVGLYAHLSEVLVFPGQRVRSGEVVAIMGNTGLSRGSHLHFELYRHGRPIDPAHRFARRR